MRLDADGQKARPLIRRAVMPLTQRGVAGSDPIPYCQSNKSFGYPWEELFYQ